MASDETLPTRAQLRRRHDAYSAAYRREGHRWVVALMLGFLPGSGAAIFLRGGHLAGHPAWVHLVALALFVAVIIAPFLVILPRVARWEHRLRRQFGLLCPSCGAALTARALRAALVTGKCGRCGAAACADGGDTPDAAPDGRTR